MGSSSSTLRSEAAPPHAGPPVQEKEEEGPSEEDLYLDMLVDPALFFQKHAEVPVPNPTKFAQLFMARPVMHQADIHRHACNLRDLVKETADMQEMVDKFTQACDAAERKMSDCFQRIIQLSEEATRCHEEMRMATSQNDPQRVAVATQRKQTLRQKLKELQDQHAQSQIEVEDRKANIAKQRALIRRASKSFRVQHTLLLDKVWTKQDQRQIKLSRTATEDAKRMLREHGRKKKDVSAADRVMSRVLEDIDKMNREEEVGLEVAEGVDLDTRDQGEDVSAFQMLANHILDQMDGDSSLKAGQAQEWGLSHTREETPQLQTQQVPVWGNDLERDRGR